MAAVKISEQTAITAAETATADLFTVVDISANANKKLTRDELITMVANNAVGLTSALTGAGTASGDLFLIYDVSGTVMSDITRDELITATLNNATSLTSVLLAADTAADDAVLVYDTSALVMKDMSRTEFTAMVAANLAANSVANAALQAAVAITTSVSVASGTALTKMLSATATLDFGSIATLASEDLTVAVVGAAVGDAVHLGLPAAPAAGIAFNAFVSAADVVTVRAHNYTAGPVDPTSATYRVVVTGF